MRYCVTKYLRNHFKQFAVLFICLFLLGFATMFAYALGNTNKYIEDRVKGNIAYDISVTGGICDDTFVAGYFEPAKQRDYLDSYYNIRKYCLENDADFIPMVMPYVNNTTIYRSGINDEYTLGQNNYRMINLYGVEESFFDENDIDIIAGRPIENSGEMVVNENTYLYYDGLVVEAQVGDILEIYIPSNRTTNTTIRYYDFYDEPLYFEIVGIYAERKIKTMEVDDADFNLNNRYYIHRDDALGYYDEFMERMQNAHVQNDEYTVLPTLIFHDLSFSFVDEATFIQKEEEIKNLFNANGFEELTYHIESSLDWVNSIIKPLVSMEEAINFFALMFIIMTIILSSLFISLSFYRQRRANAVKMVMGMSYKDVLKERLIENIIVGALGFVLGTILFRLSFFVIIDKIFKDSVAMQNQLLRISSGEVNGFDLFLNVDFDPALVNVPWFYILAIFVLALAIIVILTVILYHLIQPRNIKTALTGGN